MSVRTLFVVAHAPYPVRSGGAMRTWQSINVLASKGPVHVVSVGDQSEEASAMPVVADWTHIANDEYSERQKTGIGRLTKLLRPRQFPIQNDFISGELNRRLEAIINRVQPDTIILSNWKDAFPDALRKFPHVIVDAQNIESVLAHDIAAAEAPLTPAKIWELRRFRARERALFRRAWSVWVPSEEDARVLTRVAGRLPRVKVWPNAIDTAAYGIVRDGRCPFPNGIARDRPTIMFSGYFVYPPNRRAAQLLVTQILPRVRALVPNVRLLLVGKDPTPEMLQAAESDPAIIVTGSVPDVRPFFAVADVAAIPLTEGGGTRLKILEAFAAGLPVISTSKGIEGIEAEDGMHLLVRDDFDQFAGAVAAVLARTDRGTDPRINAALDLVRKRYSWETLTEQVDEVLPRPIVLRCG